MKSPKKQTKHERNLNKETLYTESEFDYSVSDETFTLAQKKAKESNIITKTSQKKKPNKKQRKAQKTQNNNEAETEMNCSQSIQDQQQSTANKTEI